MSPMLQMNTNPWVPEEFGEHDEVSTMQREAHIGSCDGEHSHTALLRELELLTQLLALG